MATLEAEILHGRGEQLKADKISLVALLALARAELDAALLKIDCNRDLIERLRGMNADWMARALKAEAALLKSKDCAVRSVLYR